MLASVLAFAASVGAARAVYPRYLERRAARRRPVDAHGIVRGAASIRLKRQGAPAVLVLHGAGDTPQVVAGIARHLYDNGFSVRAPLLHGHGRALRDLHQANARRWAEDVQREFDTLTAEHPTVAVVGLSMGGALAVALAARRRNLCALVLLAPYIAMPAPVRVMARLSKAWGWLLPYFPSGGRRSIHDAAAASRALGHGLFTPNALVGLADAVSEAQRSLPSVVAPTLLIQSIEDNRIARTATERAFARLGAPEKEVVWTRGAGHVITVDYGHERVFELTTRWIRAHIASGNAKGEDSLK